MIGRRLITVSQIFESVEKKTRFIYWENIFWTDKIMILYFNRNSWGIHRNLWEFMWILRKANKNSITFLRNHWIPFRYYIFLLCSLEMYWVTEAYLFSYLLAGIIITLIFTIHNSYYALYSCSIDIHNLRDIHDVKGLISIDDSFINQNCSYFKVQNSCMI